MRLTASSLRQNIYRILDKILETGKPVEIERKGKKLKIIPLGTNINKIDKLKKRNILAVDPNEIVHLDWSDEWKI